MSAQPLPGAQEDVNRCMHAIDRSMHYHFPDMIQQYEARSVAALVYIVVRVVVALCSNVLVVRLSLALPVGRLRISMLS